MCPSCPPLPSVYTTFLKHCVRGEGLQTTTYDKTVVGCRQGHAPCNIVLEVKASGPPHVLRLWLGVSKGTLPV